MKPRLVIVTLLILTLAVPATMLAQQSKAEQEVRAAIEESRQAQLKGGAEGAAILEKSFADDYTRIFTDGRMFNKKQTLDNFRAGKIKYESFEISDLRIRIYGNTAVSTAFAKTTGTTYGVATSPTGVRQTQVLVKRNGKWQAVLAQTTKLSPATTQASAAQLRNQLVGTYRLVKFTRTWMATGETEDTYGKVPQGYLMYSPNGRMMVLLAKDKRPKPSDLEKMTDQERADLFRTMIAYAGTYDFDGRDITHHIDVSWNENWVGTNQIRHATFEGQRIVLSTDPHPDSSNGKLSVAILTFEKID
jgi:hypothetical protein